MLFEVDVAGVAAQRALEYPSSEEYRAALAQGLAIYEGGDAASGAKRVLSALDIPGGDGAGARVVAAAMLLAAGAPRDATNNLFALGDGLYDDPTAALLVALGLEEVGDLGGAVANLQLAIDRAIERRVTGAPLVSMILHQSRLCALNGDPYRANQTLGALPASTLLAEDSRLAATRAAIALASGDYRAFRQQLGAMGTQSATQDWYERLLRVARRFGPLTAILDIVEAIRRLPDAKDHTADEVFAQIRLISAGERPRPSRVEAVRLETRVRASAPSSWALVDGLMRLAVLCPDQMPVSSVLSMLDEAVTHAQPSHDAIAWSACALRERYCQLIGAQAESAFEGWPQADGLRAARLMNAWSGLYLARNQVAEAGLCAGVALALAPADQAIRFSFAQCLAIAGLAQAARDHFAQIGCIASDAGVSIQWPPGWPAAPSPIGKHLAATLPQGRKWPRISVVIPTYNQGWAIEETILSLLNQGYPDLQIIVIDGGSTDQTPAILDAYRARLDYVVSEPDRGQSDAINKGMARADGELVTWLNSDDMLYPGATFAWALKFMETQADVVFGMCVTHTGGKIGIVNMPRARQEDFRMEVLGNINEYWMKGHYFYQPEVMFTRDIWLRAGGQVDADNFYCMDYDLWARMARAGAQFVRLNWPTALFRHHQEQKTSNLDRCLQEQGDVRDRFLTDILPPARKQEIADKLRSVMSRKSLRVGILSMRKNKIFSSSAAAEVERHFAVQGIHAQFAGHPDECDFARFDIVIVLVHLVADELALIRRLRRENYRGLIIGWYWDNHHMWQENLETSQAIDISIPGHAFAGAYLRTTGSALWDALPLCITQWTYDESVAFFRDPAGAAERERGLYGGFVRYPDAKDRNKRLDRIMASGLFPKLYYIDPDRLSRYFTLSPRERFDDWQRHATSFVVPFDRDLSQRFFDAWLTGQVPVVAAGILDFQHHAWLSQTEGEDFVVAASDDIDDIVAAHRRALEIFDRTGADGIRRRHLKALNGNLFVNRIDSIIKAARDNARKLGA